MAIRARLTGFGGYLPKNIVMNEDLATRLDTSDEWIRTRTGIMQRHLASEDETAVSMAVAAAKEALQYAQVDASQVDAVLVATATPDQVFPAVAVRVQAALGISSGFAFDLSAACSGFVYALATANAYIVSGMARRVLVIGSEVYSRILDWSDRATCVLFGDGAGAVLLEAGASAGEGLLSTHLHSDGEFGDLLFVGRRGDEKPTLHMNGREVFRHAVTKLSDAVDEALHKNDLKASDISWLVPHQANLRIIEGMAKKLGLSRDRVVVTVDQHANTSAASIPLAMNVAIRDGRIKPGELVLIEALGGGLTWGSALIRV